MLTSIVTEPLIRGSHLQKEQDIADDASHQSTLSVLGIRWTPAAPVAGLHAARALKAVRLPEGEPGRR